MQHSSTRRAVVHTGRWQRFRFQPRRARDGFGAAAAARGVPAARGEDRADLRLARAAGPRRRRLAERPPRGGLGRAARVVDGAGAPVRGCGVQGRGGPAEQKDPGRVRRSRRQTPRRDGVRRALGFGHGMLSVSSRSFDAVDARPTLTRRCPYRRATRSRTFYGLASSNHVRRAGRSRRRPIARCCSVHLARRKPRPLKASPRHSATASL